MPLHRLEDYYPDYRETLADGQMDRIGSYSVYTQGEDKVGTAKDLLVDDSGYFRYLVVDTGPWIFGKDVLLPIGLAHFDYDKTRVYVDGLTKSQVEHLPKYNDDIVVDEHHEDQVRKVYQPIAQGRSNRQFLGNNYTSDARQNDSAAGDLRRMPPLGNTGATGADEGDLRRMGPLTGGSRPSPVRDQSAALETQQTAVHDDLPRHSPSIYDQETGYYGLSEEDNHGLLRSYEERLIARRYQQD
ncbi:PRC-barrel domain-containing protein [Nodosilinea sp. LEGE 07298]|jgi:stress response protein YsnF|uniref:PRC-barrel domain-containing protein n=1 Tax=Nodosilinea sp. LEGE 07298 TaxID=2777970 RepID=UPI001881D63D|nr:PRC-barrel domain-containing protein [Nodosilinea sp. LEGE 07298]MBE9111032.1 PRC-barrel domain-containing protein [Nodosilinea sp. LEGE 07298]